MIGFRDWGLGFSLITIFFLIFVFLYPIPYTLYPTNAAESTPSAEVNSKLEQLKQAIASKAAQIKKEVSQKLENKAYVGTVHIETSSSLTLQTLNGPKMVDLNQDTVLPKKSFGIKDYIAALGNIDDAGVLTAKKIVLLPQKKGGEKTYLWGQIISISDELITIKTKDRKNVAVSKALGQLKIGQFLILTGMINKNEIFEASFVYVKKGLF